jgi:phage terminase small subunit
MSELTPRQRRFCEEYIVDLNASAAARRAGYSADTAYSIGHENLKKPEVAAEIERLQADRSDRTEVTADEVVLELRRLAFVNMLDYITIQDDGSYVVDFSMLNRAKAAAVREVTVETYTEGRGEDAQAVKRVKFTLADKKSALELLGKHLGLFPNQLNLKAQVGLGEEWQALQGMILQALEAFPEAKLALAQALAKAEANGSPGR